MRSILVIGGAGFIGSHTVVELVKHGYRPVVVDNFSNSHEAVIASLNSLLGQKIICYTQDYQDIAKLEKIIKKERIEGIIHFAAYKAVGESVEQPLKYYDNNVGGFVRLLQTALSNDVQHMIFSSSAAVYGNPPVAFVTETVPCNPTSPYGWSKYMDEIVLRDACLANSRLHGTALRYFNVVGAHESAQIGELAKGKPQNLLPIIAQAIVSKIPLTVFGSDYPTPDGTCLRDYVHVVDLAQAHVAALNTSFANKHGLHKTYNIGTGKPTSVMELISTFERVNNIKVPYRIGPRRAGDPVTYYASAAKANKALGWKATKTIEDAVRDAWNWQQSITSIWASRSNGEISNVKHV